MEIVVFISFAISILQFQLASSFLSVCLSQDFRVNCTNNVVTSVFIIQWSLPNTDTFCDLTRTVHLSMGWSQSRRFYCSNNYHVWTNGPNYDFEMRDNSLCLCLSAVCLQAAEIHNHIRLFIAHPHVPLLTWASYLCSNLSPHCTSSMSSSKFNGRGCIRYSRRKRCSCSWIQWVLQKHLYLLCQSQC